MFEGKRIGLVGCGNMGSALASGALDAGLSPQALLVYDIDADRAAKLAALGATAVDDPRGLVERCDIVVLAVKPQSLRDALPPIAELFGPAKLLISILAGVRTAALEEMLPPGTPVVRAMPNTPALVRMGFTALCKGSRATEDHVAQARELFSCVGEVFMFDEDDMDAVTAVSGSGPAYVFYLIETLAEAGVRVGLPQEIADRMALATVRGAAELQARTGESAAELRRRVTSPGGTTEAALAVLAERGWAKALVDAVAAARRRSRELSSA